MGIDGPRAAPCCGIRQQRRAELARIQISHSLSVERPRGSHSSSRQKQERAHITATCPTPHATRHAPHAPSYLCETPSLGPCSSRGGYCCRRPPRGCAPWRHAHEGAVEARTGIFCAPCPAAHGQPGSTARAALSPAGTHSLPLAQSKGKVFLKTRKRAHHASRGPAARRG